MKGTMEEEEKKKRGGWVNEMHLTLPAQASTKSVKKP